MPSVHQGLVSRGRVGSRTLMPEEIGEPQVRLGRLRPLIQTLRQPTLLLHRLRRPGAQGPKPTGPTSPEIPRLFPGHRRGRAQRQGVSSPSDRLAISPTAATDATAGWSGPRGSSSSFAERPVSPRGNVAGGVSFGAFHANPGCCEALRRSRPTRARRNCNTLPTLRRAEERQSYA